MERRKYARYPKKSKPKGERNTERMTEETIAETVVSQDEVRVQDGMPRGRALVSVRVRLPEEGGQVVADIERGIELGGQQIKRALFGSAIERADALAGAGSASWQGRRGQRASGHGSPHVQDRVRRRGGPTHPNQQQGGWVEADSIGAGVGDPTTGVHHRGVAPRSRGAKQPGEQVFQRRLRSRG
jgi:hypothetical protein